MSSQLKQRVDTTLSGLSWREADSMRTLQMMKGEIKVKKRLSFGMAIAMALILASMALAVAEIVRYSVKEYQALDNKVAEQHITAIGQELKHEDVEIYVTDSLFDGSILSLAFEAKPISGKPVYVIAKLTAKTGDKALSSHVHSAKGLGFEGGFWVPERGLGAAGGRYGLDMQVDVGDAKGDISWELSFDAAPSLGNCGGHIRATPMTQTARRMTMTPGKSSLKPPIRTSRSCWYRGIP